MASYENAGVVLIPVPYEKTTTYGKGTKNGPAAILDASINMELFDDELNTEPYKIGVHVLPQTEFSNLTEKNIIDKIESAFDRVLGDNKLPIMLGGEHTISSAGVRSAKKFSKGSKCSAVRCSCRFKRYL